MTRTFDVYGIGNALVDIQYEVGPEFLERMGVKKGLMTLVDEPRQRELLEALAHLPLKRSSGGSAANTMVGLAQLGGSAAYGCKVADDDFGHFYIDDLRAAGIACDPTRSPTGVTGTCLVLITPDADRTMNTFLGITSDFGPDDVDENRIARASYVYIEGYLMTSTPGLEAALHAQQLAGRHDTKVALTLSDPSVVAAFHEPMSRVVAAGVDVLFCNEAEAQAFTGLQDTGEALQALGRLAPRVAVTRGPAGALLRDGERVLEAPGFPVDAVDTNGAGDLFAGAFLYGITSGRDAASAGKLATYASSRIVAQYGPRLETPLGGEVERILDL